MCLALLTACADNGDTNFSEIIASADYLTSDNAVALGGDGDAKELQVKSNSTWSAATNAAWLELSTKSGSGVQKLTLKAAKNPDTLRTRTATLVITSARHITRNVTVSQGAATPPPHVYAVPAISTFELNLTDVTTARFSFLYSSEIGITDRGVCYSATNATPTTDDQKVSLGRASRLVENASGQITSLQRSTKYYVRAYATNASGTGYSSVLTITTDTDIPGPDDNVTP
jgi:hypothetical protein